MMIGFAIAAAVLVSGNPNDRMWPHDAPVCGGYHSDRSSLLVAEGSGGDSARRAGGFYGWINTLMCESSSGDQARAGGFHGTRTA